jgi:hypothetical protein
LIPKNCATHIDLISIPSKTGSILLLSPLSSSLGGTLHIRTITSTIIEMVTAGDFLVLFYCAFWSLLLYLSEPSIGPELKIEGFIDFQLPL